MTSVVTDAARCLAGLCRVADLLCLDLTVEGRRHLDQTLTWDVRYDLPAGPVTPVPREAAGNLAAALHTSTVDTALAGLAERGRDAPGHFLVPLGRTPDILEPADPARLARRITRTAAGHAGAQAIWRDQHWWYAPLQQAGLTEARRPIPGGWLTRLVPRLLRVCEPPDPTWQGPPIPHDHCPTCVDVDRPRRPCATCRDTRQVWLGLNLTVTDLDHRARHDYWLPESNPPTYPPLIGMTPDGHPVVQLPNRYRLDDQAAWLTDQPSCHQLTLIDVHTQASPAPALRHGHATLTDSTTNPVSAYLAPIVPGLPGGRLLIAVPEDPPAPPTTAPDR